MTGINADLIFEKIKNIETTVGEIKAKLEKDYVTQSELEILRDKVGLLQKIVFGFVGLILVAIVGARLSLIIK